MIVALILNTEDGPANFPASLGLVMFIGTEEKQDGFTMVYSLLWIESLHSTS